MALPPSVSSRAPPTPWRTAHAQCAAPQENSKLLRGSDVSWKDAQKGQERKGGIKIKEKDIVSERIKSRIMCKKNEKWREKRELKD